MINLDDSIPAAAFLIRRICKEECVHTAGTNCNENCYVFRAIEALHGRPEVVYCFKCQHNIGLTKGMYEPHNIQCSQWGLSGLQEMDYCGRGKNYFGRRDNER